MNDNHEHSRAKSESKAKRNKRKKAENLRLVENEQESSKAFRNKVNEACDPVTSTTEGGLRLIRAIRRSTIVFVTGCPGTGKTFIPTALAADDLVQGRITQIICTRPTEECGKDMGALPGDIGDKFGPFMSPITSVLESRIGGKCMENYIKDEKIMQTPLNYMRGSSIDNAVIIADEMQNADKKQMQMLLTRIGKNTTLIINADINQSDIRNSGLEYAIEATKNIKGIEHVTMHIDDIVRSGMCKDITIAFWGDED